MISTCIANANIAIIKYWGNKDENEIIPYNSSLSFTMDSQLSTISTVEYDDEFLFDELWINDKKARDDETARISWFFDKVREKYGLEGHFKVISRNSFPKGAGLASSASAFASISGATLKSIMEKDPSPEEISLIAKYGSGSATRSVFGGLVEWRKDDGAVQILPESEFSDWRNVIALVEKGEKKVGSRKGMAMSVRTSPIFQKRIQEVEKRIELAKKYASEKDFQSLAPIIMEESDSLHRVMRTTTPPLIYLNETSHRIMERLKKLNVEEGEYVGAYTFDAGPNCNIYCEEKNADLIKDMLSGIEGVKDVLVCKIGGGIRFVEEHLY